MENPENMASVPRGCRARRSRSFWLRSPGAFERMRHARPFQTAETLDKQVAELALILNNAASAPVTLIGHSWGAWLCTIVAAAQPGLVSKLIIIGSGPFEPHYAEQIISTRLARIAPAERERYGSLMRELHASNHEDKRAVVERLDLLAGRTISIRFRWLTRRSRSGPLRVCRAVRRSRRLRQSGELRILPPRALLVVAIHGTTTRTVEGVVEPLTGVAADLVSWFCLNGAATTPGTRAKGRGTSSSMYSCPR